MKYLKIEDNKCYFSINGEDWLPIDEITKEHLLTIVNLAVSDNFEMDEYDSSKIANQAHQIIYKNLAEKIDDLLKNKKRFTDESELLYKEALSKYR